MSEHHGLCQKHHIFECLLCAEPELRKEPDTWWTRLLRRFGR
jgi:hypothetical protein